MGEALISRRGGSGMVRVDFVGFDPKLPDVYEMAVESAPNLSQARVDKAAAALGDNVLVFGGNLGNAASTVALDTVDVYNASQIRSTGTPLSVARTQLAAAVNGSNAIVGGGMTAWTERSAVVDVYNANLVRSSISNMSNVRCNYAATTVGAYTLFLGGDGGQGGSNTPSCFAFVDAYDSNLVKVAVDPLSNGDRLSPAAITLGDLALVAGGYGSSGGGIIATEIYNAALVHSTAATLTPAAKKSAALAGGYALFAGGLMRGAGVVPDTAYDTVDAFNANLTKSTAPSLLTEAYGIPGASVESNALFAMNTNPKQVQRYNSALVRGLAPAPPEALNPYNLQPLVAVVGNRAYFFSNTNSTNRGYVCVYTIPLPTFNIPMPIGSIYNFDGTEKIADTTMLELSGPFPINGYIKYKKGVINNG